MSHDKEQVSDLPLEERRGLLSELSAEEVDSAAEMFPLSFAQQRLWFLAQLEPDNPAYNLPHNLRLTGSLNVDALERTITCIVARHEVLRTTFPIIDGQPMQVVSPATAVELPQIDLMGLPAGERETAARERALVEARRPFDLRRDRPLRATLIRLDENDHLLLLTMHHIVSDGWSMGILGRELSTIYEALATNQTINLPELPVQYADFAEWQREWLQGDVLQEQLDYWLDSLAGAPSELELPTDHPRPAQQSFHGASLSLMLSPKLNRSLTTLSQREGVTLFMTLLAAFQTLLFRFTGQEDIVVGTPIAGRNRVEIEGLIGFFVNTLALRTNVSRNLTFLQLLSRVKEVALGAYAHQDLPFEKLVEKLNPERSVSHTPIFQVMFGMQNSPGETRTPAGLTIKHMPVVSDMAKFDLTLFVTETSTGLNCRFEYNTDLFDQSTIQSLLKRFEILLESIVVKPDEPISQIPLLTETEQQLLLVEWNGRHREYPKNECVTELFEAQVARTPDAVAVVFGQERLTYEELNRKSNQLAHYLRNQGVGPEDRVGVCLRRTPAMLIAILGTLKAGGAYVPLDPAYPQERVAFTLQNAEAAVLLTESALSPTLPKTNSRVVCMDSEWPSIAAMNQSNPVSGVHSQNLAYVIYTSGSTGQPKGVAIEHASAVAFLHWALSTFTAADLSAVLFSTSICFDLSVFEMFAPLSSGGKAVLVENALQLADMAAADVTLVNTVPSAMAELTRLRAIPPSVRTINLAGEPLPNSLVQDIYRQDSVQRVLNLYGPSEDTTYSTFAQAPKGATEEPSIGRPIANTEVYLLDRLYQPVPIGVPGELYLGGEGLARGYLNRPDLTAEQFVPNPFSHRANDRLYKTGDLARYRPDGSIQFLGRQDHQVKLRGYRIELGEIEATLRQHPGIQDAVVLARQSPHVSEHLVGYVVADVNHPEFQSNSNATQIREHLKKKLPDYMLPGYFVFLEKLPLTPNGKVDRRALPLPNGDRPGPLETHLAPRDDLERRLARIWEKLLGVEAVGIRDDFFELGGHSLLAVRLVSEIEKEVGQRLPLASFFPSASIESLARLLREDVSSFPWPTLVEIQPGGLNPPLFCVSHPGVNALGYRSLARHLGSDQPVFGLQSELPEDLKGEYSQAAVDRLALEYLEALRAVRPTGPYQFVGLCRGAHIAFEMARHLEREGQQVALLGILDTWVNENTYNYFWYIEDYWTRLGPVARVGLRKQLSFIKKKTRDVLAHLRIQISTLVGNGSAPRKERNLLHDVYFPGPDFVPHMYEGRIAVFRVSKQPRSRIRDWQLGWGRLAKGGVDVNVIPGGHGSLLKEPHVQGLAAELKKYLVQHPHEPTEE